MKYIIVLQVMLALHYVNSQGDGQHVKDTSGLYISDNSGQYRMDSRASDIRDKNIHKEEASVENPYDITFREGFGEDSGLTGTNNIGQPEAGSSVPVSLNPSVTLALLGK
ncbi:unnamed protein product [Diamesa tonsa]